MNFADKPQRWVMVGDEHGEVRFVESEEAAITAAMMTGWTAYHYVQMPHWKHGVLDWVRFKQHSANGRGLYTFDYWEEEGRHAGLNSLDWLSEEDEVSWRDVWDYFNANV